MENKTFEIVLFRKNFSIEKKEEKKSEFSPHLFLYSCFHSSQLVLFNIQKNQNYLDF